MKNCNFCENAKWPKDEKGNVVSTGEGWCLACHFEIPEKTSEHWLKPNKCKYFEPIDED